MLFLSQLRSLGIKWYEWMFIGSFVLLLIVTWWQSSKLEERNAELTESRYELRQQSESYSDLLLRMRLDDRTIVEYLNDLDLFADLIETQNREFLNEYTLLVRQGLVVNNATPDEELVTTVPAPDVTVQPPEPPQAPSEAISDNERARVALIAKRLHDAHTCATAPSSDCTSDLSNG